MKQCRRYCKDSTLKYLSWFSDSREVKYTCFRWEGQHKNSVIQTNWVSVHAIIWISSFGQFAVLHKKSSLVFTLNERKWVNAGGFWWEQSCLSMPYCELQLHHSVQAFEPWGTYRETKFGIAGLSTTLLSLYYRVRSVYLLFCCFTWKFTPFRHFFNTSGLLGQCLD